MDIAITPILQGLISDIVSSLLDKDIFGYYYITTMVITGSILKQNQQNDIYEHLLRSEIKKEFKEQMRGRVYKFKLLMRLDTTHSISVGKKISSFYNMFLRGELRIVASTTHWYDSKDPRTIFIRQGSVLNNNRLRVKGSVRHLLSKFFFSSIQHFL